VAGTVADSTGIGTPAGEVILPPTSVALTVGITSDVGTGTGGTTDSVIGGTAPVGSPVGSPVPPKSVIVCAVLTGGTISVIDLG
jgi:hypothetical protein